MIVEWILGLVEGFVDWVITLFDGIEIPAIVSTPTGAITQLAANVQSMGVWVPWGILAAAVAASLGVWAVMFLIKFVKQILAHVPAFGGAG